MGLILANQIVLLLAALTMLVAAGWDAAKFRIPNLSCLTILVLFPLYVLSSPTPLPWGNHIVVFAIILAVGYVLYLKKLAGAGDIKLIAAISLWAGPSFWGEFLFITAFSGGVLSLGIGALTLLKARLAKDGDKPVLANTPIPYGVAIAVGGLCTLALLSHPDLTPRI